MCDRECLLCFGADARRDGYLVLDAASAEVTDGHPQFLSDAVIVDLEADQEIGVG